MLYVEQACNTFRRSESLFVNEYLKNECEKLVSGLRSTLSNTKFRFITSGYHFVERNEEVTLKDEELLVFRAQKISGSLNFISNIRDLAHVITIDRYIQQLESLNNQYLPTISSGIAKLQAQLETLEHQLVPIKSGYEVLKERRNDYEKERDSIRESLAEQGLPYGLTTDHFNLKYPEYPAFEKELEEKQQQYYDIDRAINIKNRALEDCEACQTTITNYFAHKNNLLSVN